MTRPWPARLAGALARGDAARADERRLSGLRLRGVQRGLSSFSAWSALNERAFEKLREGTAVFPLVIVPGFHQNDAGGVRTNVYRLQKAARLVQHGWASAILVSGGHVRGNFNEAAWMARALQVIGERLHVDLRDRVLLEPCAAATSSNLRNSLKMVEAMQLERALLVTEGRALPAQSSRFDNMDGLALSDLDCHVGTVSRLRGPASTRFAGMLYLITALDSEESKSKFYGTGRASLFLVRPHGRLPDGRTSSTSECRGGRPDSVRANKVQQPSDCQVAGQPVVGNCAVPADTIKLGRR